jgi:8-oxo-dGTP pyrophosphatase MutT (NUDIX family)
VTTAQDSHPAPSVVPKLASTVMLVRDGEQGIEVFMVARNKSMRFAGGALVFPGGKVDPEDRDPIARAVHDGPDSDDDEMTALRASAVREVFEETGVLLAYHRNSGAIVDGDTASAIAERHRAPLLDNAITMAAIAEQEGLVLSANALARFSHWVTPKARPVRFDTHFFLTAMPSGHTAVHDGSESVASQWITASNAVEDIRDHGFSAMFPTLLNLELLATTDSVAQALEAARKRTIVKVTPTVIRAEDGSATVHLPADAGYGITTYPFQQNWVKSS